MNISRIMWVVLLSACGVVLVWTLWGRSTANPIAKVKRDTAIESAPIFKEATGSAGLAFRHWCGDSGKYYFPEIMGAGIALFDYDRDGDLDIFAVQGMPPAATEVKPLASSGFSPTSRLFQQTSKGHFEDVTVAAGLEDHAAYGMGAAVGDVNNDGWPDLYVSKFGSDRLFLNREGKFEDITQAAGIDNPRWGTSVCFFDYDRDGWLDLFVANFVDYYASKRSFLADGQEEYVNPNMFKPVPAKLFRNLSGEQNPPGVLFRDVSLETGIDAKPGPGLGVIPADFNGDGWVDLYVANDSQPNFLWINQGGKSFVDEAVQAGAACDAAGVPQASMGVAAGDVDGDGRQDLFMTHMEAEYSTLYLQIAPGLFEDRTAASGLAIPTLPTTGFGTAMADLDQDGDLDLVSGNGRIRRPETGSFSTSLESFWLPFADRNEIFLNGGDGIYTAVAAAEDDFLAHRHVTRGLAMGDLDGDGDLDMVTSEINGPARILLNIARPQGNWLMVRAVDPRYGGRDAYGATVTVAAGKQHWSRDINPAYSYLSSNDPRAHFGLGTVSEFDGITVLWPDGKREKFPGGTAGKSLTLSRGTGVEP